MANGYEPGDYLGQFLQQLPQIYQARQNAQLQRESFEYYKQKDAQALEQKQSNEQFRRNNQACTQMQSFAGQLPFGERTAFLQKQVELLPKNFIESQNLNKFIENYKTIEDNEVEQQSMFENLDFEDSPDKIDKALELGLIQNPSRIRMLKARSSKLRNEYGKQKPFEINKLNYTEQRLYKLNEKLLSDAEEELARASEGVLGKEPDPNAIIAARKKVEKYKTIIDPYVQKGSPTLVPEFKYTPESLKSITDDPDLLSSFFADPSNDMDAFIQSRRGTQEPPEDDKIPPKNLVESESIWEPYEKETILPRPGGGFKVVKQTDYRLKSDAPKKYKSNLAHRQDEARLKQMVSDLERRIATIDANIAQIGRVVEKKVVKAGMGPTSIAPIKQGETAKDKQLKLKRTLEAELEKIRLEYEKIRRPFPEVIRDEQ